MDLCIQDLMALIQFPLKVRLWEQNHKNLNNFCVTTDMTVVTERSVLYAEESLMELLIDRISKLTFVTMVTDLPWQER